jgi:hypothetical protein
MAMRTRLSLLAALTSAVLLSPATALPAAEDAAEVLHRQTQELMDALAPGSASVWERYLHEEATLTTEDGSVLKRAELVAQIKPLPEGVTGTIEVIEFEATVHGPVAVARYITDEHETYHGHRLHCQYRATDSWLKTPEGWRLLASQILALRTDPPAIDLAPRQLEEYIGRYRLAPTITYDIRRTAGGLVGQRSGRETETLLAEAPDVLFVPGKPRYRKVFKTAARRPHRRVRRATGGLGPRLDPAAGRRTGVTRRALTGAAGPDRIRPALRPPPPSPRVARGPRRRRRPRAPRREGRDLRPRAAGAGRGRPGCRPRRWSPA